MALNQTVETMVQLIGHDGSEILWPSLPEPFRRRGHHIEEIQYVAFKLGISLAPFVPQFEYNPGARKDLKFAYYNLTEQFQLVRKHYNGILLGEFREGHPHATAWNATEGMIYDPEGGRYPDVAFRTEVFYAAISRA